MRRDQALALLRQSEPLLRARGVAHLRLFGSVARDEATEESDVDVIVEMERPREVSLFDLGGIQQDLADLFGKHVDLSQEHTMKERVRMRALREAVLAF